MEIVRTVADVRRVLGLLRGGRHIGLVPTMGALHDGHGVVPSRGRGLQLRRRQPVRQPDAVRQPGDLDAYPRDEPRDARIAEQSGVDWLFAPAVAEMFAPGHATWVAIEGAAHGPGGRFSPRSLPGRRHGLPQALRHRRPAPRVLRTKGRAAGRRRQTTGARFQSRPRDPRRADGARSRWPRAVVAKRPSVGRGTRASARDSAGASGGARRLPRRRRCRRRGAGDARRASSRSTSRSPISMDGRPSPSPPVSARTRLIDNIPLGER